MSRVAFNASAKANASDLLSGDLPSLTGQSVWLGAFYFLQLLGGSDFSFFCRSRWLARQRHDFRNFEACRLHDVLQVARAQPAHGLAQTAEGGGRDARAARQPVAEDDIVSSPGTDAVGRQQAGDFFDIQGVLQRRLRIDVARGFQRQGE